jgi:hypothetical protein
MKVVSERGEVMGLELICLEITKRALIIAGQIPDNTAVTTPALSNEAFRLSDPDDEAKA